MNKVVTAVALLAVVVSSATITHGTGLGEERGGENTAVQGAARAQVFAGAAKHSLKVVEKDVAVAQRAAEANKKTEKAVAAEVEKVTFAENVLKNNESNAEKELEKTTETARLAKDDQLKAQARLQAAIAESKAANSTESKDQAKLNTAERAEHQVSKDLGPAQAEVEKLKKIMEAKQHKFLQVNNEYNVAEHHLAVLTGVARKGETAVQYMLRKSKSAHGSTLKHLSLLDAAIVHAADADAKLEEASEAQKHKEARRAKLLAAADATKNKAEELRRILEEAIKNGSATDEMKKAAQEAAQAAEKARVQLVSNEEKLKALNKQAGSKDSTTGKAAQKLESLMGIKSSEKAHLKREIMNAKEAQHEEKLAGNSLNTQSERLERVSAAAKKAAREVAKRNVTLAVKEGELDKEKETLVKESKVVDDERAEREKLAKQQEDATHISIPPLTDPDEARKILSSKEGDLRKLSTPLLSTIEKEKAAMLKKKKVQKEVQQLSTVVHVDQQALNNTEHLAASFQSDENKTEAELKVVKLRVEGAKKSVADTTAAEHKTKAELAAVEKQTADATQVVAMDKKKQDKLVEELKETTSRVEEVEEDAPKTGKAKLAAAIETTPKEALRPFKVVNVNATLASLRNAAFSPIPEKKTQHEKPSPKSVLKKLMAGSKCADHSEWKQECPYLHEHCGDFMAMKLFCRSTCNAC